MSTFEVLVRRIDDVVDHPDADRLSICRILGFEAITNKLEDGSHRFQPGELVVYVPEDAVVPEDVLKERGYWNDEKDRGLLAGSRGDRVKAMKLRGIFSQGLVWKVVPDTTSGYGVGLTGPFVTRRNTSMLVVNPVQLGDDVADFFGITKYEPPIPAGMGGEVAAASEFTFTYDIENWQNFPGFLDNDEVEAVEKAHGTNFRVCYRPGANHPEMFGDGDVGISSKGLGSKGLMFKNNEQNEHNLYVRVAKEFGLIERIKDYGDKLGQSIDLFGEIFGQGVQRLAYGQKKPTFRAFDIAINGHFLDTAGKEAVFAELGVERLPVLYRGPWNEEVLISHRDGKTMIAGDNIREGIVVTAVGDQSKRQTPCGKQRLRPFLKMVSPAYLLKTDGSEVQ